MNWRCQTHSKVPDDVKNKYGLGLHIMMDRIGEWIHKLQTVAVLHNKYKIKTSAWRIIFIKLVILLFPYSKKENLILTHPIK